MDKGETSVLSDHENDVLSNEILSRGQILHLGLVHPKWKGECYVVPMNYGYDPQRRCIFMHTGYHDGSLKYAALEQAVNDDARVCFQVETDVQVLPMAGGTPCLSTTRYCSVLGFGRVTVLGKAEEKEKEKEKEIRKQKEEGLRILFRQSTGLGTEHCPELPAEHVDALVVVKLTTEELSARRHGYEDPLPPPAGQ